MSTPEHLGPTRRPTGPSRLRRLPVPADPVDIDRAGRTIPRLRPDSQEDDDDRAVAVDPDVWLWHVTFERLRTRDLRGQLVEEYTPYARSLARRAFHHREPLDDLRQVAVLALIGALERFQCARSIPFTGFATPTIIGALKRHHRDNDWAMRVPREAHSIATALSDAESRLDARARGRTATRADLAAELGIGEAELARGQAALWGRVTRSLDAPVESGAPALLDVGTTDEGYGQAESRLDLLGAFGDLSTRDRSVLVQYFLEDRSQREIAEALGVSQMQVSRVVRSALNRLRARMAVSDAPLRRLRPRAPVTAHP